MESEEKAESGRGKKVEKNSVSSLQFLDFLLDVFPHVTMEGKG
jgi:hypothetical protein